VFRYDGKANRGIGFGSGKMETSCCNESIATKLILIFECRMRKRKILHSFLSRQKYENLFQEKVMPVLKFLPIETLMLSGCISDIRHKSLLWRVPLGTLQTPE
jgi:hypothetical protein